METEETPAGQAPITLDELMRFLESNGADTHCPHCKSESWDAVKQGALEGVALSRLGPDALVYPDSILPTLILVCTRCAYVWPIARKRVAHWLSQNLGDPRGQ